MCGRTFMHKGVLVLVIRITAETIADAVFEMCMSGVKRFCKTMKTEPIKYHLVLDFHRTLTFPMERMIQLNQYLATKEKYMKPYVQTTSYIVQGRLTISMIETMFTMFQAWSSYKIFQCYPTQTTDDQGHGIPSDMFANVAQFMDSVVPQKAQ